MKTTLSELYKKGIKSLESISETNELDARYLLMHLLEMDYNKFLLNANKDIDENIQKLYFELIEQRKSKKPIAYITGKTEFMGIEFNVNENVLIPRPDTENLVEEILKNDLKNKTILDMCTGSGCIIISLAKFSKIKSGIGVDISDKALEVAKSNNSNNRISFIKSDLFENVRGKFDIIVSNPPYIDEKDMLLLMDDVKKYEPHTALYGGVDGLRFYKEIVKKAPSFLNKKGSLYFEIGYNQGQDLRELLKESGFENIEIIKDYAGKDRIVKGNI